MCLERLKQRKRYCMDKRKTNFWMMAAVLVFFLCSIGCRANRDDSLDKIKKAGYIRIAMNGGYPPFSFFNAKHELAGFDVDLAREVARRLGIQVKLIEVDWKDIINGLNSHAFDAILGSMAITEERMKRVDFSIPYYYSRSHVMVPKGSKIKDLSTDLQGRTVGVMEGTTFEDDARRLGLKNIRLYKNNNQVIDGLSRKEVDAIITDEIVGMHSKNSSNVSIEPVGDPLSNERIAISFRKGDESLIKKVNNILKEMQKDGTLKQYVVKMASGGYKETDPKSTK
ncbi:MAG: ABC transporter substrate-binding protein [Syntrophus sp. (in: bacteria)]|nr:ABC transporter substrate-binding protein [Syntrophus sp. (in: bacteria)]